MSNINPYPAFIPTPGKPKPARKPDKYVTLINGRLWPKWDDDRSIAQMDANEARIAADREKRAERRERLGRLCRTCKGKSIAWKFGRCPTCGNSGKRNP